MKTVALLFLLFLNLPNIAFAQTCEQQRAAAIALAVADCGRTFPCESGANSCLTLHGLSFDSDPSGTYEYYMYCNYTITYNPSNPHPPDVGRWSEGVVLKCGSSTKPRRGSNIVLNPKRTCGSVVEIENQTVGESVQVVGANFNLYYYSGFQSGRIADFTMLVPISGSTPRDHITSFDVKVYDGQSVMIDTQHFANNTPNQSYQYVWDGLDANSNESLGSDKFKIEVIENSPSGSFTLPQTFSLGHFNAKALGLGGWLPSNLVYYSVNTKELSRADGSIRFVEAKTFGSGQLYVAEADGSVVYIFDANGRHLYTKTGLIGTTIATFNYDSAGRLVSIQEPFSRTTVFNRNLAGTLTSITSPNGAVTLLGVDSNGYLSSIANPNNETFQISYHGTGGLIQMFQKPGGQTSTFTFDTSGNLTKDEHSSGYFFELIKNIDLNEYSVTKSTSMGRGSRVYGSGDSTFVKRTYVGSTGRNDTYSYGIAGVYTEEKENAEGVKTNRVLEKHDRFGKMANQEYSLSISPQNSGSEIYISSSSNTVLSNSNDPFSILSWTVQKQFNNKFNTKITTNYDPALKKFSSSTNLGKTFEATIDSFERLLSTKRGTLETVTYGYTDEKLTSLTQGTRATQFGYNTSGYVESITNALNQTTSFIYDNAGRIASKILADSRVIGFAYDSNGNLVSVTPPGRPVHSFTLNNGERLDTYSPPILSGVSIVNTGYTYNLDKQLTKIQRPDGKAINFYYNSYTGVLTNIVTPDGSYQYSMDNLSGQPSYISTPSGANVSLGYNGKRFSRSSTSLPDGKYFEYSPAYSSYYGNLVVSDSITSSGISSSIINYQYNNDEDLSMAGDLALSYNAPNGQLKDTSLVVGTYAVTDAYTYNNYGEISDYVVKIGNTTIYSLTLNRNNSGRITGKTQMMNAMTDSYDYVFDDTGRLVEAKKNTATVATYSYDSNGNRNGGVIGAQPTTATYDDQDRLNTYNTLSFIYNANGDLTSKTNNTLGLTTQYTYDVFGNLTQVQLPGSTTISYEIDGLNRRIGKRVNGILQRRWIYMDQYRIAAEVDGTGAITKRFVYGSKFNIPDYMIASGIKYRIISDQLGSPRLVVNMSDGSIAQEMDHDEFGRVTINTNPDFVPFGFAGGLYDSHTQLARFGARDYDPETGRWTSKDPILFKGGDTNLFGYVQNDPVNFIDPTGLWSLSISFFPGIGGSITIGKNPNGGNYFGSIRGGVGVGAGVGWDKNGSSPDGGGTCPPKGVSTGQYAEASANFGPLEGVIGTSSGYSQSNGPYYNPPSVSGSITPSIGVGAGVSGGFEIIFH